MSFDEYANHIHQKHRLCVALAVLKSKPNDLSSTQYLQLLKSKMVDNMDDDDVTICSDDFIMECDNETDDDSVTILKDFDVDGVGDERSRGDGIINNGNQGNDDDEQIMRYLPEDLSHIIFNDGTQPQAIPIASHFIDNDARYYENDQNTGQQFHIKDTPKNNIDIEKSNVNNHSSSKKDSSEKKDTKTSKEPIRNEKYATTVDKYSVTSNISANNETYIDSGKFNDNPDLNIDSQKTILYTVHGFTQNYTHYSPSQNQIVIPKKHLYGANRNNQISTDDDINKPDYPNEGNNINDRAKLYLQNDDILHKTQETNDVYQDQNDATIVSKEDIPFENRLSQNMYNNFSQNQNDFGYSESILMSQNENNYAWIGCQQNNPIDSNVTNLSNSQNIDEYFNELQRYNDKSNFNETNNDKTIDLPETNPCITNELTQINTNISQNIDNPNTFNTQTTNLSENQIVSNEILLKEVIPNDNLTNLSQNFGPNVNFSQQNNNTTANYEMVEEEADQAEIIPYKVLEELNKIKIFLRRRDRRMSCDGYSTDSGYRSDSQIRSSNRSALQLSGISINQSAYCLFNHIMQCPLLIATRDITSEIAQTLGQLIDKLHEEESYPPFLEELLDSTHILLRQVYRGQSSDDSEFLRKDEFVQRILLLNRSIHIQNHTIEKISSLLTKFHEKITNENDTYELINIDEIENASYVFHILEILIKKYIQIKNISCQNCTQLSQEEEKIFKKSSITDIWRKKWNPNLKINEGSRENRCVLKTCSEILNKIVVDCVNSYSVVAFAALKCFNSIQS